MSHDDSFRIPDQLSSMTGFTGKFVNDEIIGLHSFQPIFSQSQDAPTKFANTAEVNVFHVSQNFILDDPIVKTLISESNSIFYNLQKLKKRSNDCYLMSSKAYRSAIRTMLNKLQEKIEEDEEMGLEVSKYENFMTIFYSVECLWHLVEILLIDQVSPSIVSGLIEWTKFHFPSASQRAGEMLINMERDIDSSSSSYWSTIKTLILQGQVDTARAILRLHSSSETMTFQLADKDLSSMPVFNSMYGGGSLQKFRTQFSYWSSGLQSRIESGLYSTEPELEEIMKLIIGNIDSWREVTKESTCWYEYFAGYLLFNQPAARYFELGPFVDSWLAEWVSVKGGTNTASLKHLDRSILAIMKNDITEFVSLIQNVADNKWFVVHLVDLLMHSNKLCLADDDNNTKSSKILRENLVADYGIMLMSRENMWKIGFEYLEFCTSEEMGIRDSLLTRIPIKNDVSAMKMISFVRRFGLVAVEQEICKIMYRRAMTLQRYGNALEWAIRSRDNVHVTKIANIFLDHYCKTGEMMHRNLLSQLGSKLLMFVAPRLLFLIKYFDFHTLYRSRQFPQAAELIVGLMDSKIVPPFFWPTLMADTLPLLEHQDPIIPSKETYIIMRHIENNLVPLLDKMKKTTENETEKEENLNLIRGFPNELIQLLRLACTRNLSRALMIENTL